MPLNDLPWQPHVDSHERKCRKGSAGLLIAVAVNFDGSGWSTLCIITGDYRDQLPPLIHELEEQYAPVVRRGRWTHGLFEVCWPPPCLPLFTAYSLSVTMLTLSLICTVGRTLEKHHDGPPWWA
jgi:hypothetical protein